MSSKKRSMCFSLFTDRVRSTTGRLCFDTCLSVCLSHTGGGGPWPGPDGAGGWGGTPARSRQGWGRGTPARSRLGGGGVSKPGPDKGGYPTWLGVPEMVYTPPPAGMGYNPARLGWRVPEVGYPQQGWGTPRQGWSTPSQVRMGGYPRWIPPCRYGVPPWPGQEGGTPPTGMGYPPPRRHRTTDGVLDTPRSVCLLRSRRTVLLQSSFDIHLDEASLQQILMCIFTVSCDEDQFAQKNQLMG